jgi:hypothetical protein
LYFFITTLPFAYFFIIKQKARISRYIAPSVKITYNEKMTQENRQSTRYKEIGKVVCDELCALSGILDDISATGCKIHYSYPVVVDLESEYDLEISPASQYGNTPLRLKCKPQWVNEKEGNTFIGLEIMYSPDANRLSAFITQLEDAAKDPYSDIN